MDEIETMAEEEENNNQMVEITWEDGMWSNRETYAIGDTVLVPNYYPESPSDDFLGWYTLQEGGEKIPNEFTATKNNTFFAHWREVNYNITGYQDGGLLNIGIYVERDANQVEFTQQVVRGSTPETFPTISRNGYTFVGWFYKTGEYKDQAVRYNRKVYDNFDVYAQWTPITYDITWDAGAEGAVLPDVIRTYTIETEFTPGEMNDLPGKNFVKWVPEKIVQGTTGNLTFTGVWQDAEYTLKFLDENGDVIVQDGKRYEFSGLKYNDEIGADRIPNNPHKKGYDFIGWEGGAVDQPTPETKIIDDLTYTAKFNAHTWTIIFNYNKNNSEQDEVQISGVEYGTRLDTTWASNIGIDVTPTFDSDHQFVRWKDTSDNSTFSFNRTVGWDEQDEGEGISPENRKYEFFVEWADQYCNITWNADGILQDSNGHIDVNSHGGGIFQNKVTVKHVKLLTPIKPLPDPINEGYSFVRWYDSTHDKYLPEQGGYPIEENTEFKAVWKQDKVIIEFQSNPPQKAISAGYRNYIYEQETLRNIDTTFDDNLFTISGYTMLGWSVNQTAQEPDQKYRINYDEFGIQTNAIIDKINPSSGNKLTLYAIWEEMEMTVTFDPNAQDAVLPGSSTRQVPYQGTINDLPTPTRQGYQFDGWYTLFGIQLTETMEISADITFYAKWNYISPDPEPTPDPTEKKVKQIDYFDDSQFEVFNDSEYTVLHRYAGKGGFLYHKDAGAQYGEACSAYTTYNKSKLYTVKGDQDSQPYYRLEMLPGRTAATNNDIIKNNKVPIWQKKGYEYQYWFLCTHDQNCRCEPNPLENGTITQYKNEGTTKKFCYVPTKYAATICNNGCSKPGFFFYAKNRSLS